MLEVVLLRRNSKGLLVRLMLPIGIRNELLLQALREVGILRALLIVQRFAGREG